MFTAYLKQEKGFYRHLWVLALPIILQNLITSALGFADIFMVGLLGNAEMAAVTAANVPIFITQVMLFGLQSGLTVIVSQYWGKRDIEEINRALGLVLALSLLLCGMIASFLFLCPRFVLGLITDNPLLVELGTPYLQIVGFSYVFGSVSSLYAGLQRSTERPTFGLAMFSVSMCCNTLLNYLLIFGHAGLPAMGISGAAIATLLSRVLECAIAVFFALRSKRIPILPAFFLHPGKAMFQKFLRYALPVLCDETLWSLGTSMLTVILGHMSNSQDMLAAYAVMGNIDKFATVLCFGLAGASAIIVGKSIGEGQSFDRVYHTSWTLLLVSGFVGLFTMGLLLILLPTVLKPYLFPLFDFTIGAETAAITMYLFYALVMPLRAFDITNIIGILRAGGDAKVAVLIDLIPLWGIAVPLTALTALWWKTDLFWICLAIQGENFFKLPVGIYRLRSRKWIRNFTQEQE